MLKTWIILLGIWLFSASASGERIVKFNNEKTGFTLLGREEPGLLKVDDFVGGHIESGDNDISIAFRLRNCKGRKSAGFSIYLFTSEGDSVVLEAVPMHGLDPLREKEETRLRLYQGDKLIEEKYVPVREMDNLNGFNTLRLERVGNSFGVYAGRIDTKRRIWLEGIDDDLSGNFVSFGIKPLQGNVIEIEKLQLVSFPSAAENLSTGLTPADIETIIASNINSPCGYWSLLDFDFDDRYVRNGGDYNLAIVPLSEISLNFPSKDLCSSSGSYAMIYLSGAKIDSEKWKYGMLKGVMEPTSLSSVWRLKWFDSQGEPMDTEETANMSTASMDDNGHILTLSFPERYSGMRLIHRSQPD